MNARQYRTGYSLSALDFPAIDGLGQSTLGFRTDPPTMVNNMVNLKISMTYILIEYYDKKEYQVLTATSVYEIPANNIKAETVYRFYQDATAGLNEAFASARKNMPLLPAITFPTPPIEAFQREIGGVLSLINTLN
jgi:hypothetical protein